MIKSVLAQYQSTKLLHKKVCSLKWTKSVTEKNNMKILNKGYTRCTLVRGFLQKKSASYFELQSRNSFKKDSNRLMDISNYKVSLLLQNTFNYIHWVSFGIVKNAKIYLILAKCLKSMNPPVYQYTSTQCSPSSSTVIRHGQLQTRVSDITNT